MYDAKKRPEESARSSGRAEHVARRSPESRPAGLLDLQRSVGNAATVRIMRAPEDDTAGASGASKAPDASGAELDTTEEDRQAIRDYRDAVEDPRIKALLDELVPYLDQVSFRTSERDSSGGYTRPEGDGYRVNTSRPPGQSPADRIAVLVHELTHVAVDRAYSADMLNVSVPPLTEEERADVLSETGGKPREEDFQNKRLGKLGKAERMGYMDHVSEGVQNVLKELPQSGLSKERQGEIASKLTNHAGAKPYHEYDGVLSHVLVWAAQDGADRSTAFYRTLSDLVAEAGDWRAARQVPLADMAAAQAPAAGAPAAGGRPAGGRFAEVRRKAGKALKKLARLVGLRRR